MKIQSINNQTLQSKPQFKGTVDHSLKIYFDKCAAQECDKYVKTFSKNFEVDKNALNKIQDKWNELFKIFNQKAEAMHKDIKLSTGERNMGYFTPDNKPEWSDTFICAENGKIKQSIDMMKIEKSHYNYKKMQREYSTIGYDVLEKLVNEISPKDIESKMLEESKGSFLYEHGMFLESGDFIKTLQNICKFGEDIGAQKDKSFLQKVKGFYFNKGAEEQNAIKELLV